MKYMKHWLPTAVLLLSSTAMSAYDFQVNGICYDIMSTEELTVEVVNKTASYMYEGEIVIPSRISHENKEYTVKAIGHRAFEYSLLTSVTLPETCTEIGSYAFSHCTNLVSISLPRYLSNIEKGAFEYCTLLATMTLPDNLMKIEDYTFNHCSKLTTIIIPKGVERIGYRAFWRCENLESISIPNNVVEIGEQAFCGCENLKSITLPSKLEHIEPEVFSSCSNLRDIVIPENVKSIGKYAFSRCESLTYLNIPNGVTTIGTNAFAYSGLEKIIIPDEVKVIETATFAYCTNLVNIVIPSTVNKIKMQAFAGCSKLVDITLPNISSIEEASFNFCESLTCINIPNSVNSIERGAFEGCSKLANIDIPNSVATIGLDAFTGCSSLVSIKIPNSVYKIEGHNAFRLCTALTNICVEEGNPTYDSRDQCNAIVETSTNTLITGCQNTLIPNTVKIIGYEAFAHCVNLTDINIPNSVTIVTSCAFKGCSNLDNINLPSSVESIYANAFESCTSLKEIVIPQTTTRIGDYAFYGCTQLKNIIIEERSEVLELGSKVFYGCLLDSVYIGGRIKYSTSKQDGYSPFYSNKSLRTVVISNQEEQIYKNEFYGCTNLKHVNIGDGVSNIGDYAFSECLSLENISLGDKTSNIGEGTFTNCRQLKSIICKAMTPPSCYDDSFNGVDKNNCILEVVKDGVQEYKSTYPWCEFSNIKAIGVDPIYTITYMVDGEFFYTDTINYGTVITLPAVPIKEGHTFSGWSEAPETMPANDVVISGTFIINKYLVTFKIGDEVIAADSLEYGSAIVVPEAPEKEGYTFDGWGEVAETVPAGDVTYEGTYTVNIYKVYYYVGEELVHTAEVAYGEAIPEYVYEPTEEGYAFLGWVGDTYETMPAHDVVYTANIDDAIHQLTNDKGQLTIYDLTGRKVTDVENLRGGIYIVNGQKMIIND